METILENNADIVGSSNNIPLKLTTNVSVNLVSGLEVTISADKKYWADGNLTYMVVLTNNSEYLYENPIITDVLDTTLITLVENSLKIDDTIYSNYTFESSNGMLTINMENLNINETKKITFEVQRK